MEEKLFPSRIDCFDENYKNDVDELFEHIDVDGEYIGAYSHNHDREIDFVSLQSISDDFDSFLEQLIDENTDEFDVVVSKRAPVPKMSKSIGLKAESKTLLSPYFDKVCSDFEVYLCQFQKILELSLSNSIEFLPVVLQGKNQIQFEKGFVFKANGKLLLVEDIKYQFEVEFDENVEYLYLINEDGTEMLQRSHGFRVVLGYLPQVQQVMYAPGVPYHSK